jgi:hypothetical protein
MRERLPVSRRVSVTGDAARMPTEDAGLVVAPNKAVDEEDPRIAQIEAGVELADIPAALEYLQSKGAAGKYVDKGVARG